MAVTRQRTSLEKQCVAILNALRVLKNNEALADAQRTMLELCRAQRELLNGDEEKLAEHLERILVP